MPPYYTLAVVFIHLAIAQLLLDLFCPITIGPSTPRDVFLVIFAKKAKSAFNFLRFYTADDRLVFQNLDITVAILERF